MDALIGALAFGLFASVVTIVRSRRHNAEARPTLEEVNPPPYPRIVAAPKACPHGARRLINDELGYGWLVCPTCGATERYAYADNLRDRRPPQDRREPERKLFDLSERRHWTRSR